MGWDVWKSYLEADQGEDGVPEAKQWDQSCCVKQAHWAAEASSGFCKCRMHSGDGQKKTSPTTAAGVCYYQLGTVTKDFTLPSKGML